MKTAKIAAAFLAVLILGGCRGPLTARDMSREDNIIVEVVNQSDAVVTAIELLWEADGKALGSQGVAQADGSPLSKGASFFFELLENDLPRGAEVALSFAVTGPEGARQVLQPAFPLRAEFGQVYRYVLRGAREQELRIEAVEEEKSQSR